MSDQPRIVRPNGQPAHVEDSTILTPEKAKIMELKNRITTLCATYNMQLIPVVQIVGNQLVSSVEIVPIPAATAAGQPSGPIGGGPVGHQPQAPAADDNTDEVAPV